MQRAVAEDAGCEGKFGRAGVPGNAVALRGHRIEHAANGRAGSHALEFGVDGALQRQGAGFAHGVTRHAPLDADDVELQRGVGHDHAGVKFPTRERSKRSSKPAATPHVASAWFCVVAWVMKAVPPNSPWWRRR